MDVFNAVSLVTGILGVPASLYSLIQIHRERKRPIENGGASRQKYLGIQARLSELPNRVLLNFSMVNADKPGTLENLIFSFWSNFSKYNRKDIFFVNVNEFVYNPGGTLESTRLRLSYHRQRRAQILVIALGVLMLPFSLTGALAYDVFSGLKLVEWNHTFELIMLSLLDLLGIAVLIALLQRNWQNISEATAALGVAQNYAETLQRLEISVRVEFTQSRAKFELHHGAFALQ